MNCDGKKLALNADKIILSQHTLPMDEKDIPIDIRNLVREYASKQCMPNHIMWDVCNQNSNCSLIKDSKIDCANVCTNHAELHNKICKGDLVIFFS